MYHATDVDGNEALLEDIESAVHFISRPEFLEKTVKVDGIIIRDRRPVAWFFEERAAAEYLEIFDDGKRQSIVLVPPENWLRINLTCEHGTGEPSGYELGETLLLVDRGREPFRTTVRNLEYDTSGSGKNLTAAILDFIRQACGGEI